MLSAIENATRQKIEPLQLPSTEVVNTKRVADFKQSISDTLAAGDLEFMLKLLQQYQQEHDVAPLEIAAALAKLTIGDKPWLLKNEPERPVKPREESRPGSSHPKDHSKPFKSKDLGKGKGKPRSSMVQYRIEVGHDHGIKPGNIVGAIEIIRDITDRKRAEEERVQLILEQSARAAAEASERRAAFLADLSSALAASLDFPFG